MDSIIVCPFCHKGFRDTLTRCPASKCQEAFRFEDWAAAPQAYSPPEGKRPKLKLIMTWNGDEWSPNLWDFQIGTKPDSDGLLLPNPTDTISEKHARIRWNGSAWVVDCMETEDKNGRKAKTTVKLIKKVRDTQDSDEDAARESGEDVLSETMLFTKDTIVIGPFMIEVDIDYSPDFSYDKTKGIPERIESIRLDESENRCYKIGSGDECTVVISKTAPVHAEIYFQKETGSWWIVDCNSATGTKVNGEQIRNKKLEDLDKITIAGVDIVFDGNMIRVGNGEVLGVDVTIKEEEKVSGGVLKDIFFYAKPGEFIGILGPSGCGKSSLIQRLVGLGRFDEGTVRINNVPYQENEENIQSITAYIPQDIALHDNLTMKEEMDAFGMLHLTLDKKSKEKQFDDALKRVHLEGKDDKDRVGTLSGGEKRRFSIALELLRKPSLLCLDEPTAGLDPATETDIMMLLRHIANQGRTVLCSTHIMGNIRLFDKVLFLARGHMLFFGTPTELMNHFDVKSPLELYQRFGKGTKDEQDKDAEDASGQYLKDSCKYYKKYHLHKPKELALPAHSKQADFGRQLNGYLHRQFHDYFSFLHTKGIKAFCLGILTSAAFIQMLLQPIVVACVLKLACAFDFVSLHHRLYFFFSIAVFWFGLNGAIRELVKERTPWRCLERLAHISVFSYLLSKIIWVQLLCAVQVAVFSFSIFSFGGTGDLPFMWITVFVLYLICSLGAWTALAVSAFYKKENAAVGLLPIILIPALFFSNPIIDDKTFDEGYRPVASVINYAFRRPQQPQPDDADTGSGFRRFWEKEYGSYHYSVTAVILERFMPGFAPEFLLDKAENRKNAEDEGRKLPEIPKNDLLLSIGLFMFYLMVLMGLTILFQDKNERQWEGR